MGGGSSTAPPDNCHVANGTSRTLWAKVSADKVLVKEIDTSASVGADGVFSLSASVKLSLEYQLHEAGFARIGRNEYLEFGYRGTVYVTVGCTEGENPMIYCYNYVPPSGKSVVITDHGTIQLSDPQHDYWCTETGVCYGSKGKI